MRKRDVIPFGFIPMYNFSDDSLNVKEISSREKYPLRVLSSEQLYLLRGLFSFLEQGNTFRDSGYKNKIDIIGNRIVSTEYEIPVYENFKGKDTSKNRGKSENTEECRKKAARRAKTQFVDKVDSTFAFIAKKFPKLYDSGWRLRFLTLTYREEMEDRSQLANDWAKFEKRVKTYFVNKGLCSEEELKHIHYVAVPEIQKERERKTGKRVWHIHVLIFSPYTSLSEIYRVWRHGGIKPKMVDLDKIKSLGGYLAKYMDKDFEEGSFNKKRFFTSRNVKLHKVRWGQNIPNMKDVLSSFMKYAIESKPFAYKSEHLGIITGCVLLLARTDEVFRFLQFLTG